MKEGSGDVTERIPIHGKKKTGGSQNRFITGYAATNRTEAKIGLPKDDTGRQKKWTRNKGGSFQGPNA